MSLVVEDGTSKTDADSYLSVADADTYHTAHSASTDWSGAETADKEKSLRLATQFLDAKFNGLWRGYRTYQDQSLDWPRACVEDNDGYSYVSDQMPQKLLDATAELALKVAGGDTLLDDVDRPGISKTKEVKVGPITIKKDYLGGDSPFKRYPLVEELLRPLLKAANFISLG